MLSPPVPLEIEDARTRTLLGLPPPRPGASAMWLGRRGLMLSPDETVHYGIDPDRGVLVFKAKGLDGERLVVPIDPDRPAAPEPAEERVYRRAFEGLRRDLEAVPPVPPEELVPITRALPR